MVEPEENDLNNDETDDGVKDITFGDEPAKAEPIPIAWEDQIHDEAAEAADVGVKDSRYVDPVEDVTWLHERRCDCPLRDSNSESGCPNKGTVLIGETWMCPDCANNSEAAVQRVEGEEEKA